MKNIPWGILLSSLEVVSLGHATELCKESAVARANSLECGAFDWKVETCWLSEKQTWESKQQAESKA